MRRITIVASLMAVAIGLGLMALGRSRVAGDGAVDRGPTSVPGERVRVEVLNAGGVSGLARSATDRLRDAGFDVVHFGNARAFDRDTSVVIDRVGRPDLAEAVANALGIGNVLTDPDPNLFVEVTVLLGRTWEGPTLQGSASGEPPRRGPWDPRGWLGR